MAHPHQIVHVRENSEEAMQRLFDVLDKKELSLPMRDMRSRNLPSSFFNPPQRPHPNHSRENSQDSCHFPTSHALQPNHSRSHSSPAQFLGSQTLSVPSHHKQQKSVDLIDDPGWGAEQSRHLHNFGQHFSQAQQQQQQAAHQQAPTQAPQQPAPQPPPQQQWNLSPSPNKVAPGAGIINASPQPGSAQLSPQQQAMVAQNMSPGQMTQPVNLAQQAMAAQNMSPGQMTQPVNLAAMLQPLPMGWEISITHDDEIYFINHLDKTTSWFHPNIPKQQQGQGPIRLSHLPPQHQQLVQQRIQQSQQSIHQQQLQLPPGNHMMAANQSAPPRGLALPPQPAEQGRTNEILQQLQQLHMEKHKLQQQQEELARKEQLLVQRNFGQGNALPSTHNAPALQSPAQPLGIIDENNPSNQNQRTNSQENVLKDMMLPDGSPAMHPMQVTSSGVDPFLGQGQSADSHARQNSTDSGLGGMGNSYSLPRTPEDLLSNVDEMDSSNDGAKSKVHSSDFNMNDMGGMGMDISAPVDSMDGQMPAMEGPDDLIPSLQPDVLPTDLLENIDAKNIDSMLTWL